MLSFLLSGSTEEFIWEHRRIQDYEDVLCALHFPVRVLILAETSYQSKKGQSPYLPAVILAKTRTEVNLGNGHTSTS